MSDKWEQFKKHFYHFPEIGLQMDFSRMGQEKTAEEDRVKRMFVKMQELEQGAISNPDEGRMVGHYWLRTPELAPTPEIREQIVSAQQQIEDFAGAVLKGRQCGEKGRTFQAMLVIGIGGSALGPYFVIQALQENTGLQAWFLDNTDPDGMDRIFAALQEQADQVLAIVISKSGGTVETRNGMEEARRFYERQGLTFARHAVAVTQAGSKLSRLCSEEGWITQFPMWDWVGGRTSVTSAVGLLPMALAGLDTQRFLQGASAMDEQTRKPSAEENPAALLALSWYHACQADPHTQMIVLPYKDRLGLLTTYLQQLIMESLGKEKNRRGEIVHQGIAVWGRKGSSDQHSYMQQLLDGPDDFFLTFIEILQDRAGVSPVVAENSTSGDYLQAFLLGSRDALDQRGRRSLTLTLPAADAFYLGALVALFERAVGFYAELVEINAYDQPAVELGKRSAGTVIALKNELLDWLEKHPEKACTAEELAAELASECTEWIFKLLQHLAANHPQVKCLPGEEIWENRYSWQES